jgi:death-on-curing protein
LDGNKRTGFLAAALFLEINGERFKATEEEVVLRTLALAAGAEGEAEFAEWLRASCRKKRKKRPTDPGASAPE